MIRYEYDDRIYLGTSPALMYKGVTKKRWMSISTLSSNTQRSARTQKDGTASARTTSHHPDIGMCASGATICMRATGPTTGPDVRMRVTSGDVAPTVQLCVTVHGPTTAPGCTAAATPTPGRFRHELVSSRSYTDNRLFKSKIALNLVALTKDITTTSEKTMLKSTPYMWLRCNARNTG
ncbi:hypothetical protein U9M48_030320 [Paspalum notatum var. saurae]|uniref:Uncharacterized protein n=1 Tax=Paspalum notatum var. saurae TaxID=547442 RepID=A0AAQ3U534_PASNO